MSKTLCPKCSDILPMDARACACGWRREALRAKDSIDLNCPWNDHGHICGVRGSISESTHGGGPWYCSKHYWQLKGRAPREIKTVDPMRKAASLTPPVRQREPGEDSREDIGETV